MPPGVSFPGTSFFKPSSIIEPCSLIASITFLKSPSSAALFSVAASMADTNWVLISLIKSNAVTRMLVFPVIISDISLRSSFLESSFLWSTLVMVNSWYSLMCWQISSNPALLLPENEGFSGASSLGVGRTLVGVTVFWRFLFRLILFLFMISFCSPSVVSLMKVSIIAVAAMAALFDLRPEM